MPTLAEKLKALPTKPGVYLFKDKNDVVIYVGKAKSLRQRITSYFTREPEVKTSILLSKLSDLDYLVTATEMAALVLEDELIKKYKPRYNIALRDDKAYPLLKLTINEKWPRFFLARRKEKDGALYFGRYRGGMAREVIRLVKKLFPIRWCKESPLRKREQPCLYYRIGACSGPCLGKIRQEDYLLLVKGIKALLNGRFAEAEEYLKVEMEKAAAEQDFERAAYLRDRLDSLRKISDSKDLPKAPTPPLLAELDELKNNLKLAHLPMRIEAFDISNIQGKNIVGAMTVFYGGCPLKKDYRRFKIRTLAGKPNDVAALREVVTRRYNGSLAKKLPWPDLILIDGGLGQVNTVAAALGELKLPIIGLAKREEAIFFPGRSKPLILPRRAAALQLLQRIRDEVHRFVIAYHRSRRRKSLFGQ